MPDYMFRERTHNSVGTVSPYFCFLILCDAVPTRCLYGLFPLPYFTYPTTATVALVFQNVDYHISGRSEWWGNCANTKVNQSQYTKDTQSSPKFACSSNFTVTAEDKCRVAPHNALVNQPPSNRNRNHNQLYTTHYHYYHSTPHPQFRTLKITLQRASRCRRLYNSNHAQQRNLTQNTRPGHLPLYLSIVPTVRYGVCTVRIHPHPAPASQKRKHFQPITVTYYPR
ncbi:hypothetical protein L873DRAFT_188282 [Choiromyces venosus 120613-1]|uniref:Uncharacterized protein n=1 Tax=Choiromyces venosus 120613-1 TaxID=1336337 RepID=A0A3N4J2J7_9PEZI|nr:hypothetical protein L873DRAFT_188282 [Choiromyces venosus 120613-1]